MKPRHAALLAVAFVLVALTVLRVWLTAEQ